MTAMTSTDESTTGCGPPPSAVVAGREGVSPSAGRVSPCAHGEYAADGPVNTRATRNPPGRHSRRRWAPRGWPGLVFGSGMAAVAAAPRWCPSVASSWPAPVYNGTWRRLAREKRGPCAPSNSPTPHQPSTRPRGRGPGSGWSRPPTPLEVADLQALVAARAAGVLSVVDNTFATLAHDPSSWARTWSCIRYRYPRWPQRCDPRRLRGARRTATRSSPRCPATGRFTVRSPVPLETWLALRGIRTPHLRLERASANAAVLATRLADHPSVVTVHILGGAMVAFDVGATVEDAEAVCAAVRPSRIRRAWVASRPDRAPPALAERTRCGARQLAAALRRDRGRRNPDPICSADFLAESGLQ